jgi:hypothetical protein
VLEEESVEELRVRREVRENHPLTDSEMTLMINYRPDGKFWDWIANAIDRSPSTVLVFSKRWKPDHGHDLDHHIDPVMVDE